MRIVYSSTESHDQDCNAAERSFAKILSQSADRSSIPGIALFHVTLPTFNDDTDDKDSVVDALVFTPHACYLWNIVELKHPVFSPIHIDATTDGPWVDNRGIVLGENFFHFPPKIHNPVSQGNMLRERFVQTLHRTVGKEKTAPVHVAVSVHSYANNPEGYPLWFRNYHERGGTNYVEISEQTYVVRAEFAPIRRVINTQSTTPDTPLWTQSTVRAVLETLGYRDDKNDAAICESFPPDSTSTSIPVQQEDILSEDNATTSAPVITDSTHTPAQSTRQPESEPDLSQQLPPRETDNSSAPSNHTVHTSSVDKVENHSTIGALTPAKNPTVEPSEKSFTSSDELTTENQHTGDHPHSPAGDTPVSTEPATHQLQDQSDTSAELLSSTDNIPEKNPTALQVAAEDFSSESMAENTHTNTQVTEHTKSDIQEDTRTTVASTAETSPQEEQGTTARTATHDDSELAETEIADVPVVTGEDEIVTSDTVSSEDSAAPTQPVTSDSSTPPQSGVLPVTDSSEPNAVDKEVSAPVTRESSAAEKEYETQSPVASEQDISSNVVIPSPDHRVRSTPIAHTLVMHPKKKFIVIGLSVLVFVALLLGLSQFVHPDTDHNQATPQEDTVTRQYGDNVQGNVSTIPNTSSSQNNPSQEGRTHNPHSSAHVGMKTPSPSSISPPHTPSESTISGNPHWRNHKLYGNFTILQQQCHLHYRIPIVENHAVSYDATGILLNHMPGCITREQLHSIQRAGNPYMHPDDWGFALYLDQGTVNYQHPQEFEIVVLNKACLIEIGQKDYNQNPIHRHCIHSVH